MQIELVDELPQEILPLYDTSEDASFLEAIIIENETFNKTGISENDILVCFEMSHLCNYGGAGNTFTAKRFRLALLAMHRSKVTRIGERWFQTGTSNTKARKTAGTRQCQGPHCDTDISHTHGRTKFCSPRCRTAYSRSNK